MTVIRTRYSMLTDWELVQTIDVQTDALTTTDIERELLSRFTRLLEEYSRLQHIDALIETVGGDAKEIQKIIEVLEDKGCLDARSLQDKLTRSDAWYDIALDGAEVFKNLADLVKNTI